MSNLIKCMIPFVSMLSMQLHAAQHGLDKNSPYLFSDWQGMRTELLKQGIKLDANLIVDSAYLADGGYNSGNDPKYASQFLIGSTLDLEKLANWEGMTLRATITARQGQSLSSEDISDPSAPQIAMFKQIMVVVTVKVD